MQVETTRHNILLRDGDFDYLKASYPKLSATAVVRELVCRHVDELKAAQPAVDIKISQEAIDSV